MAETLSTASSGMASILFIGMLSLCCLTLLWVFADQPPSDEPGVDDPDQTGRYPVQTSWISRQLVHRLMRYVSMAVAVISIALIFGAALAFLGGKLMGTTH